MSATACWHTPGIRPVASPRVLRRPAAKAQRCLHCHEPTSCCVHALYEGVVSVGCQELDVPVCIHATGDMHPVICALQPAAMAKQKTKHAHVGALSDPKKAIRREADRVKRRADKLKRLGLKRTESDATKALKRLRARSQQHSINGERVYEPVQRANQAPLTHATPATCLCRSTG